MNILKRVGWLNLNIKSITVIAHCLAFFLIFYSASYLYVRSLGLAFSSLVLAKNFLYFSIIAILLFFLAVNRNVEECKSSLAWELVFSVCSILLFLLMPTQHQMLMAFGVVFILFIYRNVFGRNVKIGFSYIHTAKILYTVSFFTIAFFCFAGNYLNSESYLQVDQLRKQIELKGQDVPSLQIEIDPSDNHAVDDNYDIITAYYRNMSRVGFNYISDSDTRRVFTNVGDDLSFVCLFLKPEREQVALVSKCLDAYGINSKLSITEKIDSFGQFQYLSGRYVYEVETLAERVALFDRSRFPLAELMYIRGYVFHHYNSILQGMRLNGLDPFYNQYGLGPILVSKFISYITGFSYFDGLYLSIFVVDIFVLFVLIVFARGEGIIAFGYLISLVVLGFYSSILAPYLHTIRLFPVLVIVILMNRYGVHFTNKVASVLFFALFFVVGMYSKEYALLTILACFVTYIHCNDKNFIKYLISIIAGGALSLMFADKPQLEGANFLSVLLGIGFSNHIGFDFYVFIAFSGITLYLKFTKGLPLKENAFQTFVLSILLFYSVKYVTNTSANHAALLIFLIAFYVNSICKNKESLSVTVAYCYFILCIAMVVMGIPALLSQKYNMKYDVEYTRPHFSKLFMLDAGLARNAESLRSLLAENSCVIAPHDDFLQVYFNRNLTSSMPNLSTNINNAADVKKALNIYHGCYTVIVDNTLLSKDGRESNLEFYNVNGKLNEFIQGREYVNNLLRFFTRYAISNRSVLVRNEFYTVYK